MAKLIEYEYLYFQGNILNELGIESQEPSRELDFQEKHNQKINYCVKVISILELDAKSFNDQNRKAEYYCLIGYMSYCIARKYDIIEKSPIKPRKFYMQALKFFKMSIELNPNKSEYFANVVTTLISIGENSKKISQFAQNDKRYIEALGNSDKAIILDPNNYKAIVQKGYLLEELNRPIEALEMYKMAVKVCNDNHDKERYYIKIGNMLTGTEAIESYRMAAAVGNIAANEFMANYKNREYLSHSRYGGLPNLCEAIDKDEDKYSYVFEIGLLDGARVEISIDGLLKTRGKKAYPRILEIALDSQRAISTRAKAVKSIALHSKQKFDRELPTSTDKWKESDIRITELINWFNEGCPEGYGYKEPFRHPTLDNPTNEFQVVVSNFEKKLKNLRDEHQDLANPSNWLTTGNENDLLKIRQKWKLPSNYMEFLTNYSPLDVTIYSKYFTNCLDLYGSNNLLEKQYGYSCDCYYNPYHDWPSKYVVIADDGLDPFCIDLLKSDGIDAPIYKSFHGEGTWKFRKYANSFIQFLEKLLR